MMIVGNDSANKFWEWNLLQEHKIHADANELVLIVLLFIYM